MTCQKKCQDMNSKRLHKSGDVSNPMHQVESNYGSSTQLPTAAVYYQAVVLTGQQLYIFWVGYAPNPKPRYWTKDAAGREGALANDVATGSSLVKFHHVKPFIPSRFTIQFKNIFGIFEEHHGVLKASSGKNEHINDVYVLSGSLEWPKKHRCFAPKSSSGGSNGGGGNGGAS